MHKSILSLFAAVIVTGCMGVGMEEIAERSLGPMVKLSAQVQPSPAASTEPSSPSPPPAKPAPAEPAKSDAPAEAGPPVAKPVMEWAAWQQKRIEKARLMEETDPVNALMLYRSLLVKDCTVEQAEALAPLIEKLKGKALEIVRGDYEKASSKGSLRGVMTAVAVADKIAADAIPAGAGRLLALKSGAFSGKQDTPAIWRISGISTERLGPVYSNTKGFEVLASKGKDLVAVSCTLQNISEQTETSYASWAYSDVVCDTALYGVLEMGIGTDKQWAPHKPLPFEKGFPPPKGQAPFHWISDAEVFLLTDAGDIIFSDCMHKDCDAFIMEFVGYVGDKAVNKKCPVAVDKGEAIQLKLVFGIPHEMKSFRLFIPGNVPVPLVLTPAP